MFKLTIRTPYKEATVTDVDSIYVSTDGGDIQVFENHASLTASVLFSPLIVEEQGKEEHFMIRNAFFLFDNDNNEAMILADSCEKTSEISYQTVEDYAKFIIKELEEGKDVSDFKLLYLKNERIAIEEQMEAIKKA